LKRRTEKRKKEGKEVLHLLSSTGKQEGEKVGGRGGECGRISSLNRYKGGGEEKGGEAVPRKMGKRKQGSKKSQGGEERKPFTPPPPILHPFPKGGSRKNDAEDREKEGGGEKKTVLIHSLTINQRKKRGKSEAF